jgi:hypothetical protein
MMPFDQRRHFHQKLAIFMETRVAEESNEAQMFLTTEWYEYILLNLLLLYCYF